MTQLLLDDNFEQNINESGEEIDVNNDNIFNYKGYFLENEEEEEEEEQKYFEYGAHFPYKFLYQKLEILKEEREEEEKKLKKEKIEKEENKDNTFQNIFNCFNGSKGKSRNRNNNNNEKKNVFTFVPQNDKKENEKNNNIIEESKVKEHNASSNIVNNKHKERTLENNKIKNENVNLYNSFASKLKINKHLNYSKKEDEDNLKINTKTASTNSKKIKSIQLSREHLNKVFNSSQQKNKLEKKIKNKENNLKKLNDSKNKDLSSSYHHNSNYNLNNIQNKLITGSLNNIVSSYKNKNNINFSPSISSNTKKISQKIEKRNNNNNQFSRNSNFLKNPNNTKNIVNKIIDLPLKVTSERFKKNLTISTENKNKNNFQDVLLSMTNNPFNKSRNKNSINNNLTTTKSNLITDREQNSQNLTQQNFHSNNNYNGFNKSNNSNLLQTQPVFSQKKKINIKNDNKITINPNYQIKNKFNYSNNNKSKGFFNVKINLCQKSQNKILDEIKKTITTNNIIYKPKKSPNLSKKQHEIKNQNNKLNKIQQSITRNRVTTSKYNSKTITSNLYNHQKNSNQNSNNININININNNNKIIYNKIIEMTNKISKNNNRGKIFFHFFIR